MCHIFFMRSIFHMIFLSIVVKISYKETIDNDKVFVLTHQIVCQACRIISKWQIDLTIKKEQLIWSLMEKNP